MHVKNCKTCKPNLPDHRHGTWLAEQADDLRAVLHMAMLCPALHWNLFYVDRIPVSLTILKAA